MKYIILIMIMFSIATPGYSQTQDNFFDYVNNWFDKRSDSKNKNRKYSLIKDPNEKTKGTFKLFCWLMNGKPNEAFYNLDVKAFSVSFTTYDVMLTDEKLLSVPVDHCYLKEL